MKLRRFFFLQLIFILSISGLYAQSFKEFSRDSESFFKELNSLFSKVSVKENKEKCEESMEKFIEFWNTGVFTKEIKENTRGICNLMLKRRLKAYPHFYHYLSSINGLMEYDHSSQSFTAWYKSVEELVQDKRSTKLITSFLKTSFELLYENVLYRSRATEWKSSTYDFVFDFDSVPVVKFDTLNLKCYANKDSSVIYNTIGVYYPLKSLWVGKKGKVYWSRAGFDIDQVYAILDNYTIYLGFSKYSADSVKFYHKRYWAKPL